jgi:hypothetical protein
LVNSKSFVIDFIDYPSRLITLRDSDGNVDIMLCGPEIQRFNALKVGDKVTFRYHDRWSSAFASLATRLRAHPMPPGSSEHPDRSRAPRCRTR